MRKGLRFWIFRDGLYEGELVDEDGKPARPTGSCTGSSHERRSAYAEIGITTNFSFLRGGSDPRAYVHQASKLGIPAIGIADHNTLAGVVRACEELDNHEVAAQAEASDRRTPRLHRRHARYPCLSARPRRLWPALPACSPAASAATTSRGSRRANAISRFADLLEFAEGQLLVLTLPHRFDDAQALRSPRPVESAAAPTASGWRRACSIAATTAAAWRGCDRSRRQGQRAAARDQRRALSRSRRAARCRTC